MLSGSRASIVEHRVSPAQQLIIPGAFRNSSLRRLNRKDERLDPQAWLADVLARIADMPQTKLAELLPWNWRPELFLKKAA
jgi:IS66 C-terminal element